MDYLSNLQRADAHQYLNFRRDVSPLLNELARQAYSLCKHPETGDPEITDLNELVGFMLEELRCAGEQGANWFRNSIEQKVIADNEYTRSYCTGDGYIKREGPVNVLLNWSFKVDQEHIDWSKSPAYVRDLHDRHWPALMLGAFALYKLNPMAGNGGGQTSHLGTLEVDLALVVDAIAGGNFNNGWGMCEQLIEDQRSANGKAGAKARDEKYSAARKWVIGQYAAGNWPSPRAASFELAPKANEMLKTLGRPLTEQRAQITVYEWLLKELNAKKTKNQEQRQDT
ncbi:hypothetical protein [Paraburkholderia strydomiana]|uniref:hypothetical protein n=1 Tax=Paraburkholderia strydomiana TaxID=1245417 RepID=UPI00285F1656|nr:hypothetical protein [Paraburkholderia strydomiana]MDR7006068.1 hypothetical protein [Paraburkholderia strydomiana]